MFVIISIWYNEILAAYEGHDGFKNKVSFSQGNQAVNGRNRCLLVPDKLHVEDGFVVLR